MLPIHLYLCNFIIFMTGIAQVVDQYYEEVGGVAGMDLFEGTEGRRNCSTKAAA